MKDAMLYKCEVFEAKALKNILGSNEIKWVEPFNQNKNVDFRDFEKKLTDFLLKNTDEPDSVTERLRYIQMFIRRVKQPSRISFILSFTNQYVLFDGMIPYVSIRDFHKWRIFCQEVDEEVIVSATIAYILYKRFPPEINAKIDTFSLLQMACKFCLSWPMFLYSLDKDFIELISKGIPDVHIHFGEIYPAPMIWRELMSEAYILENAPEINWISEYIEKAPYSRDKLIKKVKEEIYIDLKNCDLVILFDLPKPMLIQKYLMNERILLIIGFYLQMSNKLKEDDSEAFWTYIACRNGFMRKISPIEEGFEGFSRTHKPQGNFNRDIYPEVISQLVEVGINKLDVRINVKPQKIGLTKFHFGTIKRLSQCIRESEEIRNCMEWNIIVSFNKGRAYESVRSYGVRPNGWRKTRLDIFKTATKLLAKDGLFSEYKNEKLFKFNLAGFDMIGSEFGYDVGIVAPIYQLTSSKSYPYEQLLNNIYKSSSFDDSCKFDALMSSDIARNFRRFYHSGEDRDHPITTLRVIWEAINWLGFEAQDRFGHLTVLADEETKNYKIAETFGERLDNLLWLYYIIINNKNDDVIRDKDIDGKVLEALRFEIGEISADIHAEIHNKFGKHPNIHELISAWELRQFDESSFKKYSSDDPILHAYLAFAGMDDFNDKDVLQLLNFKEQKAIISAYESRNKLIEKEYTAVFWDIARRIIINLIKEKGIYIETNPTSNLIIGSEMREETPGSKFAAADFYNHFVIGSDDPSMFKADMRVEICLLLSDLISRLPDRVEACKRLADLIRYSKISVV